MKNVLPRPKASLLQEEMGSPEGRDRTRVRSKDGSPVWWLRPTSKGRGNLGWQLPKEPQLEGGRAGSLDRRRY